jgi:purine nucleosidase
MRNLILDTDIGNDVDDIFALIMLAKRRDIRLLGVTTVYGDTYEQGQMCRYILDKLGRIDVPVFTGEGFPLEGGSILRGFHITGGFPHDIANIRVNPQTSAVDFLIEQSVLYEGDLEILAVGPLTNLGKAIQKDSKFAGRIKKLTMMGGLVFPEKNPVWLEIIRNHNGEYNISCDLAASKLVFQAGFNIDLIPLDVTTKVAFTKTHRDYFSRMPFGLGEILTKELDIWWNVIAHIDEEKDCQSNPHDPMAVVSLYDESFFVFERGEINIGSSYGMTGMTLFEQNPGGSVRVAIEVSEDVLREITKGIIK